MTHIPVEIYNDATIGVVVLVLTFIISTVFKQSKTVSVIVARILVGIGFKLLVYCKKCETEHRLDIKRIVSDWHILKTKLKGSKIGIG